jgi:hypothetical protein
MIELVALSLAAVIVVAMDLVTTHLRKRVRSLNERKHSVEDTTQANDGAIHEGRSTSH